MAATIHELKESGILQEIAETAKSSRKLIEVTSEVGKDQQVIPSS